MKPEDVEKIDRSYQQWTCIRDETDQSLGRWLAPLVDEIVREREDELTAKHDAVLRPLIAAAHRLGWGDAGNNQPVHVFVCEQLEELKRDPTCGHLLAERAERRQPMNACERRKNNFAVHEHGRYPRRRNEMGDVAWEKNERRADRRKPERRKGERRRLPYYSIAGIWPDDNGVPHTERRRVYRRTHNAGYCRGCERERQAEARGALHAILAHEGEVLELRQRVEQAEASGRLIGMREVMQIAERTARGWIVTVPRLREAIHVRMGEHEAAKEK